MAKVVTYSIEEGVAFLAVTHRPVNALTCAVRAALMESIDSAEEDDDVQEIVIFGAGSTFPASGDIAELDGGARAPFLRDLCARIDFSEKPVIAAIHGTAFGPGLELALACHYRIAAPGARASLPEVLVGLMPSGGTTQRLPRLVGAKLALDMMLTGGVVALDRAPGQQLIDAQGDTDIRASALRYAHALRARGMGARPVPPQRQGFADPAAFRAELEAGRKSIVGEYGAANDILHLVESAQLLLFSVGCEMEADLFEEALASEAASALRHSFAAERAARRSGRRPPDIAAA